MGVHWKIWLWGGGGGFTKNQYREGIAQKRGDWTVCRFKGGEEFEGGDISMHTMIKQTVKNIRLLIQRYAKSWFFRKGSDNSFSATFCV